MCVHVYMLCLLCAVYVTDVGVSDVVCVLYLVQVMCGVCDVVYVCVEIGLHFAHLGRLRNL